MPLVFRKWCFHLSGQKVFPTFCASLPSSVKHEMFGNRFELWFSGDALRPQHMTVCLHCQDSVCVDVTYKRRPMSHEMRRRQQQQQKQQQQQQRWRGRQRQKQQVGQDPLRKGAPVQCCRSRLSHWSPRLWKSTFRINRIKYYKGPNGVRSRKWSFRVGHLTKTLFDKKSKILFESRKWAFRLELLSFSKVENSIAPSSPIKNRVFA